MFNIIILGITSLLTDISTEMVYPLLPIYLALNLGAGPAVLGVIEGVAESVSSILKLFSGYFSDRLKSRKPFAILGYASSTVGKLFLYLSTSWLHVFFSRFVDRFGKGIRTAPRDALIAESAKDKQTGAAFGLHRSLDTLGACIGVFFAYLLLSRFKDSLKNVFLFSLIPAFLGVTFLFFVRERKSSLKVLREKPRFQWRSLDKRLKLFLIFSLIFTLGNSSNQFLLLRAKNAGSSLVQVLLFYLVYNLVYGSVSYPAAFISDRIGRKKVLVAGYLFYGLVYFGFAMNAAHSIFWVLFGMYGLYTGFTEGVEKALITDLAPAGLRATAIGFHAMLVGIGLFPASVLAGALWKFLGASAPFYFGGVTGIVSGICLWFILRGV